VTIRTGYQVIFLDGVALAPNNFNANPAFGNRAVGVNSGDSVTLHGVSTGLEWMW
jgi:hypothetical protein